jgi:hypothetical protein
MVQRDSIAMRAVVFPTLIRPRSAERVKTNPRALRGDAERRVNLGSRQWVSEISDLVRTKHSHMKRMTKTGGLCPEQKPMSNVIRDVKIPNMQIVLEMRIRQTKAVAPALDLVVW